VSAKVEGGVHLVAMASKRLMDQKVTVAILGLRDERRLRTVMWRRIETDGNGEQARW